MTTIAHLLIISGVCLVLVGTFVMPKKGVTSIYVGTAPGSYMTFTDDAGALHKITMEPNVDGGYQLHQEIQR